jgi:hypothetical protein
MWAWLGIHQGEGKIVGLTMILALLGVGAMTLDTIAADSLLVSHFDLGVLGRFYVVSSLVRVLAVFIYGAAFQRWRSRVLDTILLALHSGACLVSGSLATGASPQVMYLICLLQIVLPSLLPLMVFNAALSCFHPRQAKRLLPLSAAAATAGTLMVSLAAGLASTRLGSPRWFHVSMILSLLALPLPVLLARSALSGDQESLRSVRIPGGAPLSVPNSSHLSLGFFTNLKQTFQDIRTVPVVRLFVNQAWLMAATSVFVDYLFKATLKAHFARDEMAAFLGTVGVLSNSLVLAAQLLISSRFVSRFGIPNTLRMYPISLVVGAPLVWLAPGVFSTTALKGLETLFRFAFGGSIADLLLTPASPAVRTRAKVAVKGAASPLGALLAGTLLSLFGTHGPRWWLVALVVLVTALISLAILTHAKKDYTQALVEALHRNQGTGPLSKSISDRRTAIEHSELVWTAELEQHLSSAEELGTLLSELPDGQVRQELKERLQAMLDQILDWVAERENANLIATARKAIAEHGRHQSHGLELLENILPPLVATRCVELLEQLADES